MDVSGASAAIVVHSEPLVYIAALERWPQINGDVTNKIAAGGGVKYLHSYGGDALSNVEAVMFVPAAAAALRVAERAGRGVWG